MCVAILGSVSWGSKLDGNRCEFPRGEQLVGRALRPSAGGALRLPFGAHTFRAWTEKGVGGAPLSAWLLESWSSAGDAPRKWSPATRAGSTAPGDGHPRLDADSATVADGGSASLGEPRGRRHRSPELFRTLDARPDHVGVPHLYADSAARMAGGSASLDKSSDSAARVAGGSASLDKPCGCCHGRLELWRTLGARRGDAGAPCSYSVGAGRGGPHT